MVGKDRNAFFVMLSFLGLVFASAGLIGADTCSQNLDFETDAAGVALETGQIIDDEWAILGIQVTTDQPDSHPAMIFDTAHPSGGDRDLGSPNKTFAGPGKGSGGGAGKDGGNAFPLGKVLIISEDGDTGDPDDNAYGGTIIFDFAQPTSVDSVFVLDIDHSEAAGNVRAFNAAGNLLTQVAMAPLGNNSVQTVPVATTGVSRLEIHFPRSGAVAGLNLCSEPEEESICLPEIDFETDAEGQPLILGQVIDDEWAAHGVHVTTQRPWRHPAMIFDTSTPTGGDFDLGTPNADFGGPGSGSGGGLGQLGENAKALGHVLIVSEDNDANDPDDRGSGGALAFTFDQPVFLSSLDILDIDGNEVSTVAAFDGANQLIGEGQLLALGNNSVQNLALPLAGVRRLEVRLARSGALAGLTFCDQPDDPPPLACPCTEAFPEFAAFFLEEADLLSCIGSSTVPNGGVELAGVLPGFTEAFAAAAQNPNGFFCGFSGATEDGDDVFEFLQITAEEGSACLNQLEALAADQGLICN